jgi:hypothetical protein
MVECKTFCCYEFFHFVLLTELKWGVICPVFAYVELQRIA